MKTAQRLILAMLLCIALLVSIHSAAYAKTNASGTCGKNVTWTLDDAGTLSVSGSGAMDDYTSASQVPWYDEDIWAVTVEEGVTHVGRYAFSGLILDNVLLPESLESIGNRAFYDAAVTEAHFAGNLKQWEKDNVIGNGNDVLKNVIVCDKDVTYQGDGFSLANGIVKSTVSALPGDFKREYNDYVFGVVFADVTEIGESACGSSEHNDESLTNITSVTIPNSVTSIGEGAFAGCISLTNATIPNSVTNIGNDAFRECSGLTSVTIPDSITSIGEGAFDECSGLTSVHIHSLDAWCNISFKKYDSNPLRYAHNLYMGDNLVQELIIPDSVTSIGNYAFYGCSGLTSVTIPNSVTSIGRMAFEGCSGLTSVTIPDSVTSIGNGAFRDCSALTSVTIPESVTSIGFSVFSGCSGLTSVTIPDSVTSIENYAFYNCSALTSVYYTDTAVMWENIKIGDGNDLLTDAARHCAPAGGETGDCRWILRDVGLLTIKGNGRMADYTEGAAPWYAYHEQITAIDIKDMVTYLGSYAFSGLENMAKVSGMTGVTGIGEGAFKDCTELSALTLPAAVTSVGQNAFSGCTLLTSAGPAGSGAAIEFGWNRAIPANAFNGANCLRSLTIPEGVTRMMPSSAANCSALSAVSLPATLANIQQNAFSGCSSLRDVYYSGTREQWQAIAIGSNNGSLTRTVIHYNFKPDFILPAALTEIGEEAFAGGAFSFVKLSENTTMIGSNAFADCPNLTQIFIPNAEAVIDENAFGNMQNLTILGKTGSTAETYAAAHGYVFIPVS